jgi:TonB family protein
MSAIRQFSAPESEAISLADPEKPAVVPAPARANALQLLRDALTQLKSSNGDLPDQAQVANLLAEAREALERANLIGGAVAQCDAFLKAAQFEKACASLDECLKLYPSDPVLVARRRQVEEQQKAFHSDAAVRGALEEAKWLLDQDRTDLAAHLLKEKAAELPDHAELISRLEELEALLPYWEQKRHVQAALGRAATLEHTQQWQAALTILEEALQTYPASTDLIAAANRVRSQLLDHERQRKLARRVELISQQIEGQSWRQALTLLENTRIEFPHASELKPLRHQITEGLRRSECDDIVIEVRQCLADGDLEQAERAISRGLDAFGTERALEALREELESERKYRDELRTAQVLFGRHQLQEAESVLTQLAAPDRPEAQTLLDAVRKERAASEEESFFERGREKALDLIQQKQFAQAADLLRNLLALFPGNPILERDLTAAQSGLELADSRVALTAAKTDQDLETEVVSPSVPADVVTIRVSAPWRFQRAAIAGAALLVLVSAAGAAWQLSRSTAPVVKPSAALAVVHPPVETRLPVTQTAEPAAPPAETNVPPQQPTPQPLKTERTSTGAKAQSATPHVTTLRPFFPPGSKQTAGQIASSALPLPPGTEPVVTAQNIPGLPVDLTRSVNVPQPALPHDVAVAASPKPVPPQGGRYMPAELISRTLPAIPVLARQRSVYGLVKIEAVIDEHGAVKSVKVVAGDPILGAAAKSAVLTWKYRAATLNDQPIASEAKIQIDFKDRK